MLDVLTTLILIPKLSPSTPRPPAYLCDLGGALAFFSGYGVIPGAGMEPLIPSGRSEPAPPRAHLGSRSSRWPRTS